MATSQQVQAAIDASKAKTAKLEQVLAQTQAAESAAAGVTNALSELQGLHENDKAATEALR